MRITGRICFEFEDLETAGLYSANPVVSDLLHGILSAGPSFEDTNPTGHYRYRNALGVFNFVGIHNFGLHVTLHDGKRLDPHPLKVYLEAQFKAQFPDATFNWFDG